MFSFFRKKPAPAESPDTSANLPIVGTGPTGADLDAGSQGVAGDRPRSAIEWLNTDIGELFFGRKPASDASPSARQESGPSQGAPAVAAAESAVIPADAGEAPIDAAPADRSDWIVKLRSGLRRTGSSIAEAFAAATLGDKMLENLEAALLQADAGGAATRHLLEDLQRRITFAETRDPAAVRRVLADCVADLLAPLEKPLIIGEHVPTVIMVVGVNGAGKTTSVGKLARHLLDAQQKVLLAAADTFRAAAREQLLAWAERADPRLNTPAASGPEARENRIEIVSQEGGDPAGVTFDAVVAGQARGCDVVIADTAGRLATQAHLMEELKKIHRTIGKAQAGAPHEVLLVIDGNTGQNALTQVQAFDAALQLTGLIITKLDGTAKGGALAAIALWSRSREQPLPVYFVGVGEKLGDLQTFRAREFAEALVG